MMFNAVLTESCRSQLRVGWLLYDVNPRFFSNRLLLVIDSSIAKLRSKIFIGGFLLACSASHSLDWAIIPNDPSSGCSVL